VKHPVYWAGPRPSYTYELTRTSDGRIFVRYLPTGVAPTLVEPSDVLQSRLSEPSAAIE
jgi:hypothetical protein